MASRRLHQLLAAGVRAPDFQLERLRGGTASLANLTAAGPALLAFFKVTCPVCQFTLPFLERLHAAGALDVYGISQNDDADTREFAAEYRLSFPMLLDREEDDFPASNAYGISQVPTCFLVEPDGSVSRVIEGWSRREVAALGTRAGVEVLRPTDRVPELKPG
jgi:peroxiredoxin